MLAFAELVGEAIPIEKREEDVEVLLVAVAIPRAGRPVKTFVTIVPSSEVVLSASRCVTEICASGQNR